MIYMYLWSCFFSEHKICSGKGDLFYDSAILIWNSMHLKIEYIHSNSVASQLEDTEQRMFTEHFVLVCFPSNSV